MTQFRQILAPTDFSDRSRRAVRFASDEARRCGGTLHLLHVVSSGTIGHPMDVAVAIPASQDLMADAQRMLLKLPEGETQSTSPDAPDLGVLRRVQQGQPDLLILDYAREHQIDLIVLATHARSGVQRLLLGSTAESVLRHSPCPLLVVPPTGND